MNHTRTFICPRCLMKNHDSKQLNSVENIAFDMPKDIFNQMHSVLSKDCPELAKAMNARADQVRCITEGDMAECFLEDRREGAYLWGTFTLTGEWLKHNAQRLSLDEKFAEDLSLNPAQAGDELAKLDDKTVLYTGELGFCYEIRDGIKFPVRIRARYLEGVLSDDRRCARCGRLLSPDTGRAEELRILLQGSSRAGKTSCIIAIISKLLENEDDEDAPIWAQLIGDKEDQDSDNKSFAQVQDSNNKWLRQEVEYYRQGFKVEKTATGGEEPAAYSLLVKINGKELVLTFVDMPGEFFDRVDENTGRTVTEERLLQQYIPFYRLCDVVWTCLRYESMVNLKLTDAEWEKLAKLSGLTKALGLASEHSRYVKRVKSLSRELENRDIEIKHHAVVLTQTDVIASFHRNNEEDRKKMQQCWILSGGENPLPVYIQDGQVVIPERDLYRMCSFAREYLEAKGNTQGAAEGTNMCKLFDGFCRNTHHFGMAAYGHAAAPRPNENNSLASSAENNKAKKPEPFNVESPLMWTLAVKGYLPIEFTCKRFRKLGFWESFRKGCPVDALPDVKKRINSINEDVISGENLLQRNELYSDHEETL